MASIGCEAKDTKSHLGGKKDMKKAPAKKKKATKKK
jgi:hypothetical protein